MNLDCGIALPEERIFWLASCEKRVRSMYAQLAGRWPDLVETPTRISVTDDRTCIDTFIPGREEADCRFFQIRARVSVHWKN